MFLFSLAKFLFWLSITFQQRRQWNPLQYSCLEKPMDRGAWWAAVHGVAKSWTRLSDFTFTFHFHALEKEMATYSSILVWRILWTEEPGGLLSIGLHSQTWLKQLSIHTHENYLCHISNWLWFTILNTNFNLERPVSTLRNISVKKFPCICILPFKKLPSARKEFRLFECLLAEKGDLI